MIVKELIALLGTFDQSLPVAYQLHSEHTMMDAGQIHVRPLQLARIDGWVHSYDKDSLTVDYLVFPGN